MSKFGEMITVVIENFSETVESMVSDNFGILYEAVFPIWSIGVSVYFLFIVYSMIYQGKDVEIQEFIKHTAVLALIASFLGFSGRDGFYLNNIIPFVMNAGDTLSAKILDGESSSNLVQALFNKTTSLIDGLWEKAGKAGWLDDKLGAIIFASITTVIILIGGGLLAIYSFVYIIITKLMIGILLSLGGIFIMFSAFPATRGMFSSWIGSCFNYIFLSVGFSISFSVIMKVIEYFTDIQEVDSLVEVISIAFLYVTAIFLLQQVASLISALTGGVRIEGATGAVNSMGTSGFKSIFGKRRNKSDMRESRATSGAKMIGRLLQGNRNTIRG